MKVTKLTLTFVLSCLICPVVYGQITGATFSGIVGDSTGAMISDAQVELTNLSTSVHTIVRTNASGLYVASNVPPGAYKVTISARGFSNTQTNVTLTVGANQVLNATLNAGSATETIMVTSQEPTIELASSSISNEVDATTIRELPLNGRDWTQLATLQPGVQGLQALQPAPQGGYGRGNRGYGAQLSISGGRPQQNNYRIDGISVNDYSNSGPGSVLGASLGVDAIQEFTVVSSNYSADYGRTSGGVVNAVTRSGTNKIHGSAYEFARNSAMDARNYFDVTKPLFSRNQFGAAVGGPIRKDRTFFFANYEGFRQSLGVTSTNNVPTQNARNGMLQSGTVTVDPAVVPFLKLWPLPNGVVTGDVGVYKIAASQATNENFVTARVDHNFSTSDSLFGSYQFDKALLELPDSLNDVIRGNQTNREFGTLEERHVFSPALVNTARAGINRVVAHNSYSVSAVNPAAGDKTLGSVPGRYAPGIGVTGITGFQGGLGTPPQYDWTWNSFQAYDEAFFTKARHNLRFGFSFERDQDNVWGTIGLGGGWSFASLQNFLTNHPNTFGAQLPGTVTERGFRQSIVGAYLQDDFRWRPNFTVNLGVRYEISTVPTEVHNMQTSLQSPSASTAQIGGTLFSNPTLRNFEPRLGFAWDPFGGGKTSVRGGFGIFDVLPLVSEYAIAEIAASPYTLYGTTSSVPGGSFPSGGVALLSAPSTRRTMYVQSNPPRNYVMQWNLSLQHQLGSTLTGTLTYVGNRGVHQPFRADDINIVLPTSLTSQGYLWPTPRGSGTQMNPNFGRIDNLSWTSNSLYDALEAELTKHMSQNWQLHASYTWGKAIDQGSASTIGDPFASSISSLYFFDPKLRRGLSDYNVAQNLVIDTTWTLPSFHSMPAVASAVLGSWELGGIYQARTGLPFTPVLGGDALGLNSNDPWDFPDRLFGAGCGNPVNPQNASNYIKLQCFAFPNPGTRLGNNRRNSVIGPGLSDLDFTLFKNISVKRLSDSFNVQFRAELFNILNRANFLSPIDNSALFDQSGNPVAFAGAIDSTSTTAREIQLGVKVTF